MSVTDREFEMLLDQQRKLGERQDKLDGRLDDVDVLVVGVRAMKKSYDRLWQVGLGLIVTVGGGALLLLLTHGAFG